MKFISFIENYNMKDFLYIMKMLPCPMNNGCYGLVVRGKLINSDTWSSTFAGFVSAEVPLVKSVGFVDPLNLFSFCKSFV